jgi:hypothetical protein
MYLKSYNPVSNAVSDPSVYAFPQLGFLSLGSCNLTAYVIYPNLLGMDLQQAAESSPRKEYLVYGRGWTKVMNTPLVLPQLEVEICGAKANILSF